MKRNLVNLYSYQRIRPTIQLEFNIISTLLSMYYCSIIPLYLNVCTHVISLITNYLFCFRYHKIASTTSPCLWSTSKNNSIFQCNSRNITNVEDLLYISILKCISIKFQTHLSVIIHPLDLEHTYTVI